MWGELSRVPLAVDIIANCLKYKETLSSKQENTLLHEALRSCASLEYTRVKSWVSQCIQLRQLLKSDPINGVNDFIARKSIKWCLDVH